MWCLVILLCITITWAEAQNGRGPQHQEHNNGHGWDIRLAVPGEPGSDYPTLGSIPRTTFSCAGREPGYYADLETNCQVFRVCTVGSTYGFQSFLCPNGTLFNQAVFVCDWWMNVDCKNSQQFINNNNEKFENLRLGPQLMKDIKKMLTHPMLNPYDKSAMKGNLIVMQDYKPPAGQLFPNGALLAGPERPPNNVYIPSKQIQQNFIQNIPNDYSYSASTPDPRYLPVPGNTNFGSFQNNDDFFQRQRQSEQNIRSSRIQSVQNPNFISNGHAGRLVQNTNTDINAYSQLQQAPQPTQVSNFPQRQTTAAQNAQTIGLQNNQKVQANVQRAQYTDSRRLTQTNKDKETNVGVMFTKAQNNQNTNTNQDKQAYSYTTPSSSLPQFSNLVRGKAGRELKENLVSKIKDIPTTGITKTFSRLIQATKVAKPKSRVTIKTWIVKPTKAARQLADPTPYTYSRPSYSPPSSPSSAPTPSPTAKLVDETTPYVYEKPTSSSQAEEIISTELDSEEPYVYDKPTTAAKQFDTTEFETSPIYIAPTTTIPTNPTFLGRLNLPSSSPIPTMASRYYLTPAPFKTANRLYLPPPRNPTTLPRLYLSPNAIPQPTYYQSAQLRARPTMPSPTLVSPSIFVTKHNNLTFADILTKEKLDITVNDIVKDTDNILKTASPPPQNQYHKNLKSLDFRENDNIPKMATTDSGEKLTSRSPMQSTSVFSKSSRLIATPATSLVPPDESFIYQNTNRLSKLPFYKESGLPNTIERTVSIKITIPERIAMYLFRNQSESDYDKLEILNTGSSNYLVLSNNNNNLLAKKNAINFIPIAKLSGNNINNISDSQALVYSFLTDSINVAREYSNIAQQEILSSTTAPTPTPAQFQNLNNEQLSDITNKISQLTSSQFSSNNYNSIDKSAKLIAPQPYEINPPIPFTGTLKFSNEQNRARQLQTPLYNDAPSQTSQGEMYSSQYQIPNNQQNLLSNQNQVYSGQLYQWSVPEVTNHIYNRPASANLVNAHTIQQQTTQMLTLQRNTNQNSAADSSKQSSPDIEIIKAQTLPFSPAKLQLEPPNEPDQFTSQESLTNLLNTENGISAQLQDKIVGIIPHPLEENKLVTYKKDQSYYLYTKLDDNTIDQNTPSNTQASTNTQQNAKLTENPKEPSLVTFQLIPSVNYELEDEKEQQQILNAFQIDEFGAPREITKPKTSVTENKSGRQIMTSSVDFSVEHPTASRRSDRYRIDELYSGPSSYTAPQSSVVSLERRQDTQSKFISRIEDFDSNNENGYPKERPSHQLIF